MARAKRWKPLRLTSEDIQEGKRRFGTLPDSVITIFANRAKDPKAAVRACEEVLAREPENGIALLYMGILSFENKKYKKAISYFDQVCAITAFIYPAWEKKAMSELLLGRVRAARFSFGRCMELQPENALSYCGIAMTFFLQDARDSAIEFLDSVAQKRQLKDAETLLYVRALCEEQMGLKKEALLHYIESHMLGGERGSVQTTIKIRELASETPIED